VAPATPAVSEAHSIRHDRKFEPRHSAAYLEPPAGARETGVLRRTIEGRAHRLSIQPGVLSEAADWMDRKRALWGRLFDVVDEYLKEDKPR
jgi:hypothetical protein